MVGKNSAAEMVGSYNLLEKVGEGSMGTVYKASHWETGEVVAIKVMPSHIARKPSLLKRFEQEFRIASRLHHPNVVRVIEYLGSEPEPCLVMEFVDGVALGERLEKDGRMPQTEAVCVIAQIAEGLHHAHELGLLHRDVKPDNILVTADRQAKLTDLGLGKELAAEGELTRTGAGLGTPNFMAPEQFRNAKHADVRCDVYSLGATLYQMVTGELPFGEGDPVKIMLAKLNNQLTPVRRFAPDVSERVERAILRAMSPDPEQRPGSCMEFLDDLLGRAPGPLTSSSPTPVATRKTGLMPRAAVEALLGPSRTSGLNARPGHAHPSGLNGRPGLSRPSGLNARPAEPPPTPAAAAAGARLASEKYLPRVTLPVAAPPPPAPVPAVSPPASDGWRTLLLIVLVGAGALFASQLLFSFLF
jgi:serine/threonine protein kinase